ncbi:MAG: nucleotide exchange factor GrpE [Candidatus Moranbacteria bacterium]|nr:nucleotide exchange factor GrpE [Candidatus Moranbacteria bacterium]
MKKKKLKNDSENKVKKEGKKNSEELVVEYLDGWKRCQAEFENYKRIQGEERKDLVKYASQNVVMQIIPVVDNFASSVAHIPEEQKDGPWVQGIMYIQKQLEDVLRENGVEEIEVNVGDEFDANICEAIQSQSSVDDGTEENKKSQSLSSDVTGNKIKKVILKGYKIGEKVIRPARVVVG